MGMTTADATAAIATVTMTTDMIMGRAHGM